MLNMYGNYLLDRFNLEVKYPKIAKFINYRKKLSKYYIFSNFALIIIICLVNLIFGLSVFSIYFFYDEPFGDADFVIFLLSPLVLYIRPCKNY